MLKSILCYAVGCKCFVTVCMNSVLALIVRMSRHWHAHSPLEFFRALAVSRVDVLKLVIYVIVHCVYGSKCVVHIICVVISYGGGHINQSIGVFLEWPKWHCHCKVHCRCKCE